MEQVVSRVGDRAQTAEAPRRRRSSKKHRRFRGVPAPYVFYPLAFLGVAAMGVVYKLGEAFVPFSGAVCLVALYALYVNDSKGFVRRRQMRRAYEARRNFDNWEVFALLGLVMGNVVFSGLAFLT